MAEENKYMDDQFKKASEELKFPYQPSFWSEVESKLDDDSLDTAFIAAAGAPVLMPDMNITESISDAFLDDAFKSVDSNTTVEFKSEYWNEFQSNLASIEQDEAFVAAANGVIADYHPHYWSDADIALQREGLHYEYNAAYWNEAKVLLDKSDRGNFFVKWSVAAGILLLLSFATLFPSTDSLNLVASTRYNSNHNSNSTKHTLVSNKINSENLIVDDNDETIDLNNQLNNTEFASHDVSNEKREFTNDNRDEDLSHNSNFNENNVGEMNASNNNDDELPKDFIGLNLLHERTWPKKDEVLGDVRINNLKIQPINVLSTSVSLIDLAPNIHIEKLKLTPSHHFSILGHVGLGNKYGAQDLTPTLRSAGGFEYLFTPRKSLQHFEFGASFMLNHVRQNNFGTERRVNVFQTSGGVDKFWYKLQLKDMLYAGTNLGINYKFNNRNKIKFSVGVDYLIFAQSNMSYQNKTDQNITTVNNNWGVKDGLNNFDFKLGLGYEFQVTSRFALQVNACYGIMDRTDNEFMRNQINDHEISGSVGLKYTIFRK